jgi:dTMP kinase
MKRGYFITFEGGEGVGKSTQVERLAERLRGDGHEVVVTREPGGTPFAEQVRDLILSPSVAEHAPLSEALLFYAARADHIAKVIRPALTKGSVVLCDRFSDSTRVYQSLAGGLSPGDFDSLERLVVGEIKPDLTIILDLDPATGLLRADQRRTQAKTDNPLVALVTEPEGQDKYERQQLDFHQRLRAGFLAIARQEPERCVVIDAGRSVEVVASDIWSAAGARLAAVAG